MILNDSIVIFGIPSSFTVLVLAASMIFILPLISPLPKFSFIDVVHLSDQFVVELHLGPNLKLTAIENDTKF